MHRTISTILCAGLVMLICSGRSDGEALTYRFGGSTTTDSVYIESTAKLEFFSGVGKDLIGRFQFDPSNPGGGATGKFRFDLRTLNTGIDLRNEHMRENHLHTKKFPYAFYELKSVTGLPNKLEPGKVDTANGSGLFYIRGVSRMLPCRILFSASADTLPTLSITADFVITLDQFEIPRPRMLLLKLAETISVSVSGVAIPGQPADSLILPADWKALK